MKSSARDETEGKWHKVKGKVKEMAGKVSMNRGLEAKAWALTRTDPFVLRRADPLIAQLCCV